MWKGTADTLNAKPTIINTMPKIEPKLDMSKFIAISANFVELVNPYIKEHP